MGISSDAYLFYGIPFDEGEEPWNEDQEIRDNLKSTNKYDLAEEFIQKYAKNLDLGVDCHCHSSYPMWFVFSNMYVANRGDVGLINLRKMNNIQKDQKNALVQFCKNINREDLTTKINWYLVSYMG